MHREQLAENVSLYLGDCREILPTLGKADLVVTDPPYLLTSGGDTVSRRSLGGWLGGAAYGNNGKPVACEISWPEIMQLLFAALKDDSDAYVMANDKNVNQALNAAALADFGFHNLLVWDKRNAVANRWYMKNCEFVLYLWKGKAKAIRFPGSAQLCSIPNRPDAEHPTSKPAELMAHFIANSSEVGATILDPFMGVGSTGVAAARRARGFVGIEIEKEYFEIACRRISDALKQGEMFSEPAPSIQESFQYDGQDDFAKSLDVGYGAIRKRVAAGGPGWEPK